MTRPRRNPRKSERTVDSQKQPRTREPRATVDQWRRRQETRKCRSTYALRAKRAEPKPKISYFNQNRSGPRFEPDGSQRRFRQPSFHARKHCRAVIMPGGVRRKPRHAVPCPSAPGHAVADEAVATTHNNDRTARAHSHAAYGSPAAGSGDNQRRGGRRARGFAGARDGNARIAWAAMR
mgnify:CR=1 FL=1